MKSLKLHQYYYYIFIYDYLAAKATKDLIQLQVDLGEEDDIKNDVLHEHIKDLQLILLAFLVEHSEVNPELVVSNVM